MNDNAVTLVNVLTTENLQQAKRQLRIDDAFCCLGVACEVYRRANPDKAKWDGNIFILTDDVNYELTDSEYTHCMPGIVAKYFGFQISKSLIPTSFGTFDKAYNNQFNNLALLNDFAEFTLKQIGEFIQTEPEGLFGKE